MSVDTVVRHVEWSSTEAVADGRGSHAARYRFEPGDGVIDVTITRQGAKVTSITRSTMSIPDASALIDGLGAVMSEAARRLPAGDGR